MKLIAIDGHGGAGKSTLSALIAQELSAGVIEVDDFASFKNPADWHERMIKEVLEPARRGAKTVSYERSQWWDQHKPEPVIDQAIYPIMILEGVASLRKELRSYIDFAIYVSTSRKLCFERGFERDKGNDGLQDVDIIAQWKDWAAMEDLYTARDEPQRYADITVDGSNPFNKQISEVIEKIHDVLV